MSHNQQNHEGKPFLSALEILNSDAQPIQFLIDGLLPAGSIAILTGPSDTGKSMLSRQLAVDIALGKQTILGMNINARYNRAAYISTEDYQGDWKHKLSLYNASEEEVLQYANLNVLFDSTYLRPFINDIVANPVDLLVVDAFGDMFNGDINDSIQVRRFLKPFRRLAQRYNTTVLFVHHINKNGEKSRTPGKANVLGSQAIESASRCVLELRADDIDTTARTLTITKGNYFSVEHKRKPIKMRMLESELKFTNYTIRFNTKGQVLDNKPPLDYMVECNYNKYKIRELTEYLNGLGYTVGKTKIGEMVREIKRRKVA